MPAGATFRAGAGNTSGTLSWTPGSTQAGAHTVAFVAANALSGVTTTTITVVNRNQPPSLSLTVSPVSGNYPLLVSANAAGSSDPDGVIVSYRFDFGDGATSGPQSSPLANHLYARPGVWRLTVTATDNLDATRAQSATIQVGPIQLGPNLCGNGSFESDSGGWGGYGASTLRRMPGGFDGGSALELKSGVAGLGGFGLNDAPDWVHATGPAGQAYRYSAWVRSASATGACKVQIAEYAGGRWRTHIVAPPGSGKTLLGLEIVRRLDRQLLTLDYTTLGSQTTLDFQVVDTPVAPGETFLADDVAIHLLSSTVSVGDAATEDLPPLAPRFSPSPLRSQASLRFVTARRGPLRVGLYDLGGRRVRVLADPSDAPAGLHRFSVDGRDDHGEVLAAGVYFYRIQAGEGEASGRFVILR